MAISPSSLRLESGRSVPVEYAKQIVAPPRCGAEVSMLCAIAGGAFLTLEESLRLGQCCCCRGSHAEGALGHG